MSLRVLGIETSCDETAAAIVDGDGVVLSDVVHSQIDIHRPYGGVVPEIAARDHVRVLPLVVAEALLRAGLSLEQLDGVAATNRPGLSGALLVGLQTAKGLAWSHGLPFVGVDHLIGHMLAVYLRREGAPEPPAFPFVALLVSGGHSALYRVDGVSPGEVRELGGTRDDAAGEAFDKVAKLLRLGYPGGPVVDQLAHEGDRRRAEGIVPMPMARRDSLEMSFSGTKSAIARHVELHGVPEGQALADLCAAFQYAVVESLAQKAVRAAKLEKLDRVVIGGGVAANRGLRARLAQLCTSNGLELYVPPLASCTDNAAMIAYAGAKRLALGERDELALAPSTKTSLPRTTRKGGGARPKPAAP